MCIRRVEPFSPRSPPLARALPKNSRIDETLLWYSFFTLHLPNVHTERMLAFLKPWTSNWRAASIAALYFILCGLAGWYIYGGIDGVLSGLGKSLIVLCPIMLIGWLLATFQHKPVPLEVLFAVGLVVFATIHASALRDAMDRYRFARAVSGVSTEDLPIALRNHSDTKLGAFVQEVFQVRDEYQKQLMATFAEANDPAIANVLEARTLADKSRRDTVLKILETKLPILAAMPGKIDLLLSDLTIRMATLSTTAPENAGGGLRAGLNDGVGTAQRILREDISAMSSYYSHLAALIRFLDTPDDSPRVNGDGKLIFETEQALARFKVYASQLDSDRTALQQADQDFREAYQHSMEKMKESLH